MKSVINAKIVSMANNDYDNGYIMINEGKISKIDKMDDYVSTNIDEEIDAKGGYVLPGIVDAHTHIGMWEDGLGFEGDDGNEDTDPITPALRAIDAINHADRCFQEAREAGVTTVVTGPGSANVIGGQFAAIKTYGRCVDEMVIKAPCAMKIAFGENPKTVYNSKKQSPSTRMATAMLLRENLLKAKEYLEQLDEYDKDKKNNSKPDFDINLDALLKVLKGEIPLKAHAHRADDIITALRIAEEFDLDITIDHCTEGYMIKDILKEKNAKVILGPLFGDRSKPELRNSTLRNPGILSEENIDIAIMTDHPVNPEQHLIFCAALAIREGMSEKEALKAITINAARFTRIDDRVGSIEEGKDADIVVFDRYYFDILSKVQYTIIDGKVIYKRDGN